MAATGPTDSPVQTAAALPPRELYPEPPGNRAMGPLALRAEQARGEVEVEQRPPVVVVAVAPVDAAVPPDSTGTAAVPASPYSPSLRQT